MRRIPRLRHSAAFTQCLQSSASASTHSTAVRTAAATRCLSRPRDFSTTPNRTFVRSSAWADKTKTEEAIPEKPAEAKATTQAQDHVEPEVEIASEVEDPHAAIVAAPVDYEPPIKTDLVLPPSDPTIAPRLEDLDTEAEGYKPADRADTLEVVGGLKDWFAEDKNHWAPSKRWVGFAPQFDKETPRAILELCTFRAVLEASAVAALEKSGKEAGPKTALASTWRHGGREGLDRVLQMSWKVDENGAVQISAGSQSVARELLDGAKDQAVAPSEVIAAQEAEEILKSSWSKIWKDISLEDFKLRFAVAKRVYQLTGRAIPDAKLFEIKSAHDLLAAVVKPPPPRSVYEAVQQRGQLDKLPNVQVHSKRVTPVDKARTVGSWKVIEKELEKRDLPVLGHGDAEKFVETEWYKGPKPAKKDKKKRRG